MERVLIEKSHIVRGEIKQVLAFKGTNVFDAKEKIGFEVKGVFKDEKGAWKAVCGFNRNGQDLEHTSEIRINRGTGIMFVFLPLGKKDEIWEGMKLVDIESFRDARSDPFSDATNRHS